MRRAIVTGGGAGLGRFLALGFAGAGHEVVVADVDADAAGETADLVREQGGTAEAVACDLREAAECARLIEVAAQRGGPHVLVNNAGGWTPGAQWPEAAAGDWSASIALNLVAPMLLSQLVLEPMRGRGGGAIVHIASSAGVETTAYGSPEYGAAKAGLIRFTTSCTDLERTHGVRMMCVVPGWIGLDRAYAELAALAPADRPKAPTLVPPDRIVATVLDLVANGRSGSVVPMLDG